MSIKKIVRDFILALFAGLCIGVGGTMYLTLENKIAGSIFFSFGLIALLVFGFNLYTGKVGYILTNKPSYLIEVFVTWVGNLAGTYLFAVLVRQTRIFKTIQEHAVPLVEKKQNDNLMSLFILGIFCGLLMFIAVDTFKKYYQTQGFLCVYLAVFCVVVFILSGYEHCVADMYYFALADKLGACFVPLVVITIGNTIGGSLITAAQLINKKLED